jgi:hypothetical protein
MRDALVFLNLFCSGIVVGTYCFELLVVIPATRAVPSLLSAQIHGALFSHLPNRYMPFLGVMTAVGAVALLAFEDVSDTARLLYGLGLAAWAGTLVIVAGFSRPLDKQIVAWEQTALPEEDYAVARKKWNTLMVMRGPLGVAGFSCFLAASLS